jgi:hypothetical protein
MLAARIDANRKLTPRGVEKKMSSMRVRVQLNASRDAMISCLIKNPP